ncbi:hypothetical protein L596_004012 [Steinernema carpocapsae]|uniref:Uncharacterized protein n=1 Tax=Steinernema carpocapsae TaxID=34508 RepID=A0A4U8UUJ1_STECR|nr:hypothetical protein L596_004012 [Steinernema carpocapsae]
MTLWGELESFGMPWRRWLVLLESAHQKLGVVGPLRVEEGLEHLVRVASETAAFGADFVHRRSEALDHGAFGPCGFVGSEADKDGFFRLEFALLGTMLTVEGGLHLPVLGQRLADWLGLAAGLTRSLMVRSFLPIRSSLGVRPSVLGVVL